ncbi:MBL fold metallo-hydrolase [Luteolibacter flavescens]|uniref:MBL fold metallo-hydrolase n=1 Tax=Luteolibacter flavescens TaxID=1859460 RepID=A0ABT3FQN6_9BACT|nr:MBL fold metallo-hydrolase [Luteolibacter flavescens]MCW1885896.1 MBL fold metallo-hydrolase [Luteolibacter flavescens]
MLYDTTSDVIRKALRGLDLAPSEAAARSDLSEREVISASRGPAFRETLLLLAPSLGLDGPSLAGLPEYVPPASDLPEIIRLELPFDDETVNAWLVQAGPDEYLLFDTGTRAPHVRQALDDRGIQKVHVLITHQHGDHIDGLQTLEGRTLSVTIPPNNAKPGDVLTFGDLTVTVIDLPGHCQDAVGYVIEGLAHPVCVTGDALFAGSMGGCAPGVPYQAALKSLHAHVLSLPDNTILLPGHGPETTVRSEKIGNAFLASGTPQ